jgi:dolichol kinase
MTSTPIVIQAGVTFCLLVGLQLALARVGLSRESRRNVQHFSTGQAFLLVSYVLPIHVCVIMLFASAALFYYLEIYERKLFLKYFGAFLRPAEISGHYRSGAFYFLLGTAFTAALVPVTTARFALQCLATVDPVASFVGRSIPSRNINASTTVAGSLAGLVTACMIGYVYLSDSAFMRSKIFIGALTCCIVEASPYGNDNFMIPVLTSLVMEAATMLLKW